MARDHPETLDILAMASLGVLAEAREADVSAVSMNRRGFFGLFAGAATAIAAEDLELLLPKRTIFLPPAGGWIGGNRLLTVDSFVKDMLAIFERAEHENNLLAEQLNREYDESFYRGEQWTNEEMLTIPARNFQGLSFNRIKGLT